MRDRLLLLLINHFELLALLDVKSLERVIKEESMKQVISCDISEKISLVDKKREAIILHFFDLNFLDIPS